MEIKKKDYGVFTLVSNNIEKEMSSNLKDEVIKKMGVKKEKHTYPVVDLKKGGIEADNDFIVYDINSSLNLKQDNKTNGEKKLVNKKVKKMSTTKDCKASKKNVVIGNKETISYTKGHVENKKILNEIVQKTLKNTLVTSLTNNNNSFQMKMKNLKINKNSPTEKINKNITKINNLNNNNTDNLTTDSKNTTGAEESHFGVGINSNISTINDFIIDKSSSQKSLNSGRTISSIILKMPKNFTNSTERRKNSIQSLLNHRRFSHSKPILKTTKISKLKNNLYTGPNVQPKNLIETPKHEFKNPVKWHIFPTPEEAKKMKPVQLGPYQMYAEPPQVSKDVIFKIKRKLRMEKKAWNEARRNTYYNDHEREKYNIVIGRLKAADARQRIHVVMLKFSIKMDLKMDMMVFVQPTGLMAVRTEYLIRSKPLEYLPKGKLNPVHKDPLHYINLKENSRLKTLLNEIIL